MHTMVRSIPIIFIRAHAVDILTFKTLVMNLH
jgi:hypothetical protein